jgi:hypothetical protein
VHASNLSGYRIHTDTKENICRVHSQHNYCIFLIIMYIRMRNTTVCHCYATSLDFLCSCSKSCKCEWIDSFIWNLAQGICGLIKKFNLLVDDHADDRISVLVPMLDENIDNYKDIPHIAMSLIEHIPYFCDAIYHIITRQI